MIRGAAHRSQLLLDFCAIPSSSDLRFTADFLLGLFRGLDRFESRRIVNDGGLWKEWLAQLVFNCSEPRKKPLCSLPPSASQFVRMNGEEWGPARGPRVEVPYRYLRALVCTNEISRIGFVSQTTKFSGHDFCWTWPALGVMRDHQSVPLFIRYPPDPPISGKEARQCEKRCHHKQTHHRSQAPTRRRKKTTNDTAIKLIGAHWRCLRTVRNFSRLQYKKDAAVTSRNERYRSIVYFADSFRVAT